MSKMFRLAAIAGLCLLAVRVNAATNDIYWEDFHPSIPGSASVSLYLAHRTADDPYAVGGELADSHLNARILALRLGAQKSQGGETRMGGVWQYKVSEEQHLGQV